MIAIIKKNCFVFFFSLISYYFVAIFRMQKMHMPLMLIYLCVFFAYKHSMDVALCMDFFLAFILFDSPYYIIIFLCRRNQNKIHTDRNNNIKWKKIKSYKKKTKKTEFIFLLEHRGNVITKKIIIKYLYAKTKNAANAAAAAVNDVRSKSCLH